MRVIYIQETDRELIVKCGKRLYMGIAASFYCTSVDKPRLTGPGLTSVTSPYNARSPQAARAHRHGSGRG